MKIVNERNIKNTYEHLRNIGNYYTNLKYNIINKSIPTILIKKDNIEYIYNKEVTEILNWIDSQYEKEINNILIDERYETI